MPGTRPGMTMNTLIEPAMQLAPGPLLHAAPELVRFWKAFRRQAAGVGSVAAPIAKVLHSGGEFTACRIFPRQPVLGVERCHVGQPAVPVFLQADAAAAR